jgi:hypothetical protein
MAAVLLPTDFSWRAFFAFSHTGIIFTGTSTG